MAESVKVQPVAQLIHISDLHLGVDARCDGAWAALAWILSRAGDVIGAEYEHLLQGIAPHDEDAFGRLKEAILEMKRRRAFWFEPGRTALVVTGDLTTWGDDASRTQALEKIKDIQEMLDIPACVIYGNHDVFPGIVGRPPIGSTEGELALRHTTMRNSVDAFGGQWPTAQPLIAKPLLSGGNLTLFPLNTVVHDPQINSLARGNLEDDRYWEIPFQHQVRMLRGLGDPSDFKIVLTHHPIVDPGRWVLKKLANAGPAAIELQQELANPADSARPNRRVAHVILSGHTHSIFPRVGKLKSGSQSPLAKDQIQLTCGTTTQRSFGGHFARQTFQVVRFAESIGNEPKLYLERVVYYRQTGKFKRLAAGDRTLPAEHVVFRL